MYDMWYEAGSSSRSSPRSAWNQRSRRVVKAPAAVLARLAETLGERTQGDSLLLLVALDRVGDAREVRREPVFVPQQLAPQLVEGGGCVSLEVAELFAVAVLGEHRELRLRRPERHLLALERQSLGENRVLELVLPLGELTVRQARLAFLSQTVEPLVLVTVGLLLCRAERVELLAAEEVRVAGDDLRPLGDFLLPDAHGPNLLRTLEDVGAESVLVLRRAANRGHAHRRESIRARRISQAI